MSAVSPVRTAIVLAAGRGTRLGPKLPVGTPKPLVDVGGRSIFEHQVAAFAEVGVDHVVVVVGHGEGRMIEAAGALACHHPVRFTFVRNPIYAETNTVVSQYLARSWLAEGAWTTNGDVLFGAALLWRLLDAQVSAALAVEVKTCGAEEVKVVTRQGRIAGIGKRIDPRRALGEFVGVARYDALSGAAFARTLRHVVEEQGCRQEYFEVALHALAPHLALHPVDTAGEPVIEIDTPEDLARAEAEIAPRLAPVVREVA